MPNFAQRSIDGGYLSDFSTDPLPLRKYSVEYHKSPPVSGVRRGDSTRVHG